MGTTLSTRRVALFLALYLIYRRSKLHATLRLQYGESFRGWAGRMALLLAPVQKEYAKFANETLASGRAGLKAKWSEQFGEPLRAIPERGWPAARVKSLVDSLSRATHEACNKTHMSGAIYSYSLVGPADAAPAAGAASAEAEVAEGRSLRTTADYVALGAELKDVFSYTFGKAYLWNSLHGSEFGVGDWLSYQTVRMVADLYGGAPDDVMGLVTTGGTGSLMAAMRAYREWGTAARGHALGEGVVLCFESVHAAVIKAGEAYGFGVEVLPMLDESHRVDLAATRAAVARLGRRLLCIVGSTPSYARGTIDPIVELAAMAREAGAGMHVDSCLGGFVVNFLEEHVDPRFLAIDGVTSLSCDTHKNGWAPKGSSVLVTRDMPGTDPCFGGAGVNLAYWAAYAIPQWSGGIYGTPQDPGSTHVTHVLHAFCAMLLIGKDGYRQIARSVHRTTVELARVIKAEPQLELLHADSPDGLPTVNVVAWRMAPELAARWGGGAIYCLAHEMEERGVTVSACKGHVLHFCVTGRSAADPSFVGAFAEALKGALAATELAAQKVISGEANFPGDAGLYGTLEAAMEPTAGNTKGVADLVQNWLLGGKGARAGVKAYFYAIHDPYKKRVFGESR